MEVYLKADTIFEVNIIDEFPSKYYWMESRKIIEGFFKKNEIIIPEGWVEYDYERPIPTDILLSKYQYLMIKNNQIWIKTRVEVHYSVGSKDTKHHYIYFENPDEGYDYVQSLVKEFPHIHFKK